MAEMPTFNMLRHDWAMNNGKGFSLSISEPTKEELSKAGLKVSNLNEIIEDLVISGSSSKNKIKVSFDVIEPTSLTLKILNEDGKELVSQNYARYSGVFQNQIDFGRRIKGSYFFVLSANGKSIVRKINRELSPND